MYAIINDPGARGGQAPCVDVENSDGDGFVKTDAKIILLARRVRRFHGNRTSVVTVRAIKRDFIEPHPLLQYRRLGRTG